MKTQRPARLKRGHPHLKPLVFVAFLSEHFPFLLELELRLFMGNVSPMQPSLSFHHLMIVDDIATNLGLL